VARVLNIRDHRIEFDMVQQPTIPRDPPADPDHHVVRFPIRAAKVRSRFPSQPFGRQATGSQAAVRAHVVRQVVVLEVAGRLCDAVEELDRAIGLALADAPRGVVCDLSAVPEGDEPVAVEVLATAGRHVRDWPGIPVAVACPDPRVCETLRAHPLGGYLIDTPSLFSAVPAVLATPNPVTRQLRLAPHPTAPRASREFVTRTMLDWQLRRIIPFASLVVSELVASSSTNAGTDMDLRVTWDRGALRLTVRDHGPGRRDQSDSVLDLHGRRLTVVAGLSRAFGVLPTHDGGKVVWAVLAAPRPTLPPVRDRSVARQGSLIRDDARMRGDAPGKDDVAE